MAGYGRDKCESGIGKMVEAPFLSPHSKRSGDGRRCGKIQLGTRTRVAEGRENEDMGRNKCSS